MMTKEEVTAQINILSDIIYNHKHQNVYELTGRIVKIINELKANFDNLKSIQDLQIEAFFSGRTIICEDDVRDFVYDSQIYGNVTLEFQTIKDYLKSLEDGK